MPTRLLRDWTDSQRLDGISADAERLFMRLIMKADDYGRFHADPRMVKAFCFPLVDNLRPNDLSRWLDELSTRQLILRYEADGRKLLAIPRYGQRLKLSKAKFPPMPGEQDDWLPMGGDFREVPGSSGKFPLEEKRREKEEEEKGMPTALQVRIGKLLNRRETTRWDKKELAALKAIGIPEEEDLELLENFYFAVIPKDRDYRRTSLLTLLNNWNGELDKARFHELENGQ